MRRLLVLASAIVFVDTMFYAAVVPILPQLSGEFGLSKAEAGILSGAYAAGTLVASIPAGLLAARIGARRTVLVGLGLMSVSGVAFALGTDVLVLEVARFVQGIGGAASWAGALGWLIGAAPRERRGELIGTAMAAGIGGVILGPLVGGAADSLGRGPVFGGVAAVGLVLIAWTLCTGASPAPPRVSSTGMLRAGFTDARVRLGMWLILVPGLIFGTVGVLVSLRLDALGATAFGIAATFIVAAVFEAATAPIAGRISDRRGRLAPSRVGMAGSCAFLLVLGLPDSSVLLAALLVAAVPAMGMMWAPAMAMLSEGAESAGVDQGLAFGFVNLGWALGHTIGATGGSALGEAAGDVVAYGVLAAVCALTLVALVAAGGRLATESA